MKPQGDDPLDDMLRHWRVPPPPPHLEAALRRSYRRKMGLRGWRWFLRGTLSIPVPLAFGSLAAALLVILFVVHYEHAAPAIVQTRVLIETHKVEVPIFRDRIVMRTQYRQRPGSGAMVEATTPSSTQPVGSGYLFVTALRPQIRGRDHEDQN